MNRKLGSSDSMSIHNTIYGETYAQYMLKRLGTIAGHEH